MVLSQDKSVLVTMQDVVSGKPKSKWGIAMNTLYTIFTAHHILKDLSATAAVTKVKEICLYLIWLFMFSYIDQTATTVIINGSH